MTVCAEGNLARESRAPGPAVINHDLLAEVMVAYDMLRVVGRGQATDGIFHDV